MALAARQGRGGFCPGRRRRRVSGRSAAESLDRFRPASAKKPPEAGALDKRRNLGPNLNCLAIVRAARRSAALRCNRENDGVYIQSEGASG